MSDEYRLLDDECEDKIHSFRDSIEEDELFHYMIRSMLDEPKRLLYHFESGKYYLDVYEDEIAFCGYIYSVKDENEIETTISFLTKIDTFLAENGYIKIFTKNSLYIIPDLSNIEMIEFILLCFLSQYKMNLVKKNE